MDENTRLIESLFVSATEYAKTSLELVKLKTLDKSTDIVSSAVPNSLALVLLATFVLFFNVGIAFWLGDIFGKTFLGFFTVAAFYMVTGLIIHFFMHKKIKRLVGNYFIKCMLK
jgi:fatty acid desaturase